MKEETLNKWWQQNSSIPLELNDVPLIENRTTDVKNSEFIELQKKIDSLIFEFLQKHNIENAWSINYSIDDLNSLKEYGINCPSCDGSLCIFDEKRNSIITSM